MHPALELGGGELRMCARPRPGPQPPTPRPPVSEGNLVENLLVPFLKSVACFCFSLPLLPILAASALCGLVPLTLPLWP